MNCLMLRRVFSKSKVFVLEESSASSIDDLNDIAVVGFI